MESDEECQNSFESYSEDNDEKMHDAEDLFVNINLSAENANQPSTTDDLSRVLDELTLKMSQKSLKDDEDDYKLNSVESKEPKMINSSSSSWKSINNEDQIFKLFMFGEMPSKLDKAVYLAIQGAEIDPDIYPNLSQWYNYMKSKISDMHSWKTPTKKRLNQNNK